MESFVNLLFTIHFLFFIYILQFKCVFVTSYFTGLFVTGWLATGPVGVIVTTMTNAFAVGRTIANEVSKQEANKPGFKVLKEILDKKGK